MKKLPINTQNKDVVVSWVYTWARQQEMSIHEQRIILRILEFCQDELKGLKIKDHLCKLEHNKYDVTIEMPASLAIFKNLEADTITETLETLSKRYFKYEDDKRWWMCSFISSPEYIKGSGIMKFRVDNKIWDIWLNFSKGYRRFELNKALALPTTYSVQFYMLMSGSEKPISFTIEQFKEWLGIAPEAYKRKDGKNRVYLHSKVPTTVQRRIARKQGSAGESIGILRHPSRDLQLPASAVRLQCFRSEQHQRDLAASSRRFRGSSSRNCDAQGKGQRSKEDPTSIYRCLHQRQNFGCYVKEKIRRFKRESRGRIPFA